MRFVSTHEIGNILHFDYNKKLKILPRLCASTFQQILSFSKFIANHQSVVTGCRAWPKNLISSNVCFNRTVILYIAM